MNIPDWLWRLSSVNENYELCSTYPNILAVPSAVDDSVLKGSASFRSRGRIPTLGIYFLVFELFRRLLFSLIVWRNMKNYCTISRCSQPLVGLSQNRNSADENLIRCMNRNGGLYVHERLIKKGLIADNIGIGNYVYSLISLTPIC